MQGRLFVKKMGELCRTWRACSNLTGWKWWKQWRLESKANAKRLQRNKPQEGRRGRRVRRRRRGRRGREEGKHRSESMRRIVMQSCDARVKSKPSKTFSMGVIA